MKVGSFVYSTWQGLGVLAKQFYDHGIINDVMVIVHGRHDEQPWYPKAPRITSLKDGKQQTLMREWVRSLDVFMAFETPFDWSLFGCCKKSILMPMYECTPERLPVFPNLLLCPSTLDYKVFIEKYPTQERSIKYLPVPVEYPWKLRTKAEVFVHNAGHGGLKGRNGTAELLEAIRLVKSPARFLIASQKSLDPRQWDKQFPDQKTIGGDAFIGGNELGQGLTYYGGTQRYDSLFSQGDVFVFPERFNGLSLPLQEARAAGMLVMCGDRFPMNEWLPDLVETTDECAREFKTHRNPLIPVSSYLPNRIGPPYMAFHEAQFDPKVIASKIDEWYGRDITDYSKSAIDWAKSMSWETLGPKYREVLEKVVQG